MWCPNLLSVPYVCCRRTTMKDRCLSRDGSNSSVGSRRALHQRPKSNTSSELSTDPSRRPTTVFRPPRQGSAVVTEGGSVGGAAAGVALDRTSYHYLCQDVTSVKTMLLRLKRILQAADTINPFDANLRNSLYLSLANSDSATSSPGINGDKDSLTPSINELTQENVDLKRQVVLLQQQLQDKDRTIRLLQQQFALNIQSQTQQQQQKKQQSEGGGANTTAAASTITHENTKDTHSANNSSSSSMGAKINAATQTERQSRSSTLTRGSTSLSRGSSLTRTASIEDGLGPTVCSEVDDNHKGSSEATTAPTSTTTTTTTTTGRRRSTSVPLSHRRRLRHQ